MSDITATLLPSARVDFFVLDEGTQANHLDAYLVACLLAFFQQQRLFKEQAFAFRPFNIERPLWIFVGGRGRFTAFKKTLLRRNMFARVQKKNVQQFQDAKRYARL